MKVREAGRIVSVAVIVAVSVNGDGRREVLGLLTASTETVKLVADWFSETANLMFGWVFAGHKLGAATEAYGAGFSPTIYAGYMPGFFIAGALCLFGAAALLLIRERPPLVELPGDDTQD